jgi:hypothetical protein
MTRLSGQFDLSARRASNLAQPLLTYIRSNRHSIVDYGTRNRSGRLIATALAESAVNSLIARRMVEKQHMLLLRMANLNGDRRLRLAYQAPRPQYRSHFAWIMEPIPPLLKIA